jgi:hypothetical protein
MADIRPVFSLLVVFVGVTFFLHNASRHYDLANNTVTFTNSTVSQYPASPVAIIIYNPDVNNHILDLDYISAELRRRNFYPVFVTAYADVLRAFNILGDNKQLTTTHAVYRNNSWLILTESGAVPASPPTAR